MTKKLFYIILTIGLLLLLLVSCAPQDGLDVMQPEDCLADEYYDPDDQMCYLDEDTPFDAPDDTLAEEPEDPTAEEPEDAPIQTASDDPAEDAEGLADYGMTPDDCYPDEVYDADEKLCYIEFDCDTEAECQAMEDAYYSEIEGVSDALFPENFTGGQESSGSEDVTEIISYTVEGDRIFDPVTFPVSDDLLAFQQDTAKHQAMWSDFTRMIPPDRRSFVVSYTIFSDGVDETMAEVRPNPDDPNQWGLLLDPADSDNLQEFTYTLIHEYAHLLTLNAAQVPPSLEVLNNPDDGEAYDQAVAACPRYFTGEGCSSQGAYINLFFNRFWVDIIDELEQVELIEDDDGYYEGLELFYEKYKDQFVTDYAATNSGEDIAESFTHFVLKDKPAGNTIAEQKMLFFYDFPELVQLRMTILSQSVSRLRQQQTTQ